jgi:hypothetical protein
MKNKFFLAALAFVFSATSVFALPTIVSEEDQSFNQHQGIQQIRDITITDDATTPVITAVGDIRIHIPASFPVIWDNRVASVTVSGSAFNAGKFASQTPAVTYDNKAKTVTIPVAQDFAAGESVKVSGLFFTGFFSADSNARLELIVASGGSVVATDAKTIQVWISSTDDNREPAAPAGVTLTQTSDNRVKLTWIDPPDMDVQAIQILRGKNLSAVSGTPYDEVAWGVESYTDTDTALGDKVTYILRATDGRNFSALSSEVSIALIENPVAVCTTDYTPVCGSDGVTYSNACNAGLAGITSYTSGECAVTPPVTPTVSTEEEKATAAGITLTELTNAIARYSDIDSSHWSAGFLSRLTRDSILAGYPDGTVKPDTTINRAELAKIATLAFDLTTATETFTDVTSADWFAPYVGALQVAGASYTSTSRYYPAVGVSRAEAVWVLLRAAGVTSIDAVPATKLFPDVNTNHPYAGAITYAANNGIISGYENGNFGPADTLTRAQVAKIVVLIKQKLE